MTTYPQAALNPYNRRRFRKSLDKSVAFRQHPVVKWFVLALITGCATIFTQPANGQITPIAYDVKLDVILRRDKGDWCWVHPRATAIPNAKFPQKPTVLMTICREFLGESDFFSGTYVLQTNNNGKSWAGPDLFPQLDWRRESRDVLDGVIDVAPQWHAQTGKVIALGIRVRYNLNRASPNKFIQLQDKRPRLATYAVYDPKVDKWKKISTHESWVTVSELMWSTYQARARKKGAAGRTFVARILWKK